MHELPTVCHLLHSLRVGGAELLAAQYARELADEFRPFFVCLDEVGTLGEQLRAAGFRVEMVQRRPGLDWRCAVRLARLFRSERVDLVHAHQYTPFFYAGLACRLYGRPAVLFQEHGRHHPDYPRPSRILANRLLLGRRAWVVAVGEAVRRALHRNEGIPASRVRVIYNGVRLAPFLANGQDRRAIRAQISLGPDDFVAMTVARLDYLKDHATAIRAMASLCRRLPSARLVLVGEGPEEPTIRRLLAEFGLENAVRLLGLRKDVACLLQAADVFLLTSISEGIPLTLIEAMAAELPIVATDVGGVGEVVVAEETGLLVPPRRPEMIAEHLLALAENPCRGREMGRRGRQRALDHFSDQTMLRAYRRLYRQMLEAKV